jgi:hypothetical protein
MEEKNLVALKDLDLVTEGDVSFLKEHSEHFMDRYSRSSLFRSKFEMEASVLNDMVHPTVDSKYWQAIGEQAVHVKELIRLGFNGKKTETEIDLLNAQIEELNDRKEQVKDKPGYVTKKLNAHIAKKEIEIQEKQFSLTECKKVAKERIKEIKNWEEIIPPLEDALQHGKEDWEAHHPERSLLRNEMSMRNFNLLELDAKKNAVRDFTAAVKHPDNAKLVQDRRKELQNAGAGQELYNQAGGPPLIEEPKGSSGIRIESTEATMPSNVPIINTGLGAFEASAQKVVDAKDQELSKPQGMKLKSNTQIVEQPKVSAMQDFKSRDELTKNDPIAKQYFNRKVRRIMVGTPHRYQSDQNITDFNMVQMPAAIDSFIEQPWGFNVPDARNFIVEKALKEGADWIFFVDDDTIIPRNALVQLFRHNVPVSGGTYYRKYHPLESVPMFEAEDTTPYAMDGKASIGEVMHNVLVLPSGCTLIHTDVFKKMEPPYYKAFTVDGRAAVTEDTYFCQRARDMGLDVVLDTNVQCLHVDKTTGQVFGHESIVDVKTSTINTNFANYFAATFE